MTKNLSKRLDFKDIKLPVKTKDIHKIEKKKRKKHNRRYVWEICCEDKHVDLLSIGEWGIRNLSQIFPGRPLKVI